MFGLRTKKPEPEKKKRSHDLSQFGLFDVPTELDADDGDDNDSDLEAELAAITAGAARPRAPPKKVAIPAADLDRMVADSLRDDPGDDDDDDVDENDPDLLSELHGIIGSDDDGDHIESPEASSAEPAPSTTTKSAANIVDLLSGRLDMYRLAETNAKTAGDAGKARRFGRGIKTLTDQLRQAKAGHPINPDDIPPEVSTKGPAAPLPQPLAPTRAAPVVPPTVPTTPVIAEPPAESVEPPTLPERPAAAAAEPAATAVLPDAETSGVLNVLNARKREYQVAALAAKKAGERETAIQYIRVLKQFDKVIAEATAGRPVDLSAMPASPSVAAAQPAAAAAAAPPVAPPRRREEAEHQTDAPADTRPTVPAAAAPPPPTAPTSIAEALDQRLAKYQAVELAAKEEGNSGKARRYGRIIKQYQDAIKLHRLGRAVPFDELPTPPGFGPIPGVSTAAADATTAATIAAASEPVREVTADGDDDAAPAPVATAAAAPPAQPAQPTIRKPAPDVPLPPSRLSGNHSTTALMQQTIQTLQARQAEFRRAAVEAKKAGNLTQAKEYLRQFKQLEQLTEVARGGMPIDLNTVPVGPAQLARLEDTFTVVSADDCGDADVAAGGDISARLEQQLNQQLEMCRQTRDHHRAMGDVAGTNRFENLALSVQKDCDVVKLAKLHNLPVPKFHYERKRFDIVRCNTDLADTELEIGVCRGISYSVPNPKDVDTYVRVEVPLPSAEQPFKARTQLIRDTDSPAYEEKFIVEIAPKQRQCQRVFKRHAVKLEVLSKGGFLRSDVLIGTVTVKLQPLETVCELHDSFDLMDGRKTNGGKLEVKIRTRNPILTTQIEHTEQKWIVIDS